MRALAPRATPLPDRHPHRQISQTPPLCLVKKASFNTGKRAEFGLPRMWAVRNYNQCLNLYALASGTDRLFNLGDASRPNGPTGPFYRGADHRRISRNVGRKNPAENSRIPVCASIVHPKARRQGTLPRLDALPSGRSGNGFRPEAMHLPPLRARAFRPCSDKAHGLARVSCNVHAANLGLQAVNRRRHA